MRLAKEQLTALMTKHNVDRLWSWSKINIFHNSHYEYYLKYIRKIPEDRQDCIYTTTGSIAHGILENFYTGKIKYEDMIGDFKTGWMTAYDIADLKFDRNDEEHNKQIAQKYYDDLVLFFENHTPIKHDVRVEQFVDVMVDDNLFQGYIDCCYKDDEGNIHIIDFKSSSIYKGSKAENECGQLVLYAMGLHQKGIPYERLKIAWDFCKYANVEVEQANGKKKLRQIERSKLGESLQANVSMWLKKFGYANDTDDYLKALIDTNDINVLPEDIRAKYTISDCYVYVDLTEKLIGKWAKYIVDTIADIKAREKDYEYNKSIGIDEESCGKIFWDSEEDVEKNSYYYSTLCGYSPNLLLPYKQFLEKLEAKKNENVFVGVGTQVESEDLIDFSELFKD